MLLNRLYLTYESRGLGGGRNVECQLTALLENPQFSRAPCWSQVPVLWCMCLMVKWSEHSSSF